jgi:uncharacterized zinc-type alcohol dehydrogenase-like protein
LSRTLALSAAHAGAKLEPGVIERRALRDDDVLIDVAYAGICHSDIHQVREEWGTAIFPMVPGHEIAGVVSEVGATVSGFKVGDRVGVGCMVDSCGECDFCKDGEETMGGYSQQLVVSERFALRIPDALGLDVAAPLLCAGITTYNPLKRWGAGPGKKVAVIGMGGLGHMAVQIANAMGAEVSVLSRTTDKQQDGAKLGAQHYYATKDEDTLPKLKGTFDLIINTVSADLVMDDYVALLRPLGAMVNVGMPTGAYSVQPGSLVGGSRVLAGSNIGGIAQTQEMLDFCAENGIASVIETISADEVNLAYDRVVSSDVRYRFVIDTATIPAQG